MINKKKKLFYLVKNNKLKKDKKISISKSYYNYCKCESYIVYYDKKYDFCFTISKYTNRVKRYEFNSSGIDKDEAIKLIIDESMNKYREERIKQLYE